jgi:uncharacterized protein (DUF2252 family)
MHDITDRITTFNQNRIPKMVRAKYRFMLENIYRFYRGTCHIFYEDLVKNPDFPPGPAAWICGDLHLENFGSFRSQNNQVYFDLNDFDEAVLAPAGWEVARLVTSIYIGFESLRIRSDKAQKMARLFIRSYQRTLRGGKADYVEASTAKGIICDFLTSAAGRKRRSLLNKRTFAYKKGLRLVLDHPKHFRLREEVKEALMKHVAGWLKVDEASPYNYKVIDGVFRLAGTGSVGLERYAFLLKSSNTVGPKYLILDMKEAAPSSLAPWLTHQQPEWENEAARVISVQNKMQNRCPALLSTSIFNGKSFIMQEMQPSKDSIDFRLLKDEYRDMYSVIDTMGVLTASSQLRSAGQAGAANADELIQFGHDADFEQAIVDYAVNYAEQIKAYYQHFSTDIAVLTPRTNSAIGT